MRAAEARLKVTQIKKSPKYASGLGIGKLYVFPASTKLGNSLMTANPERFESSRTLHSHWRPELTEQPVG